MHRRAFLRKAALAGLGLACLPAVAPLSALAARSPMRVSGRQPVEEAVHTESEAVEDIISYIDSWVVELPDANIKEAVLAHLKAERAGEPHAGTE